MRRKATLRESMPSRVIARGLLRPGTRPRQVGPATPARATARAAAATTEVAYPRPLRGVSGSMIGFIVAGFIIGVLARLLLPGKQKIGLLWTLGLGVAGSVIGGTIANLIDTGDIFELNFIGFVAAVAASVGLLAVAERAGLGQGEERKQL